MQPSELVMNPKQVFLSVLVFGVAGLLLFMYLQVWIEEQHTGRMENKREQKATSGWGSVNYLQPVPRIMTREKIQEHITNQNSKPHMRADPKENLPNSERPTTILTDTTHSPGKTLALSKTTGFPTIKLMEIHQGSKTLFKKFFEMNWPLDTRPLNKSLVKDNRWKETDVTQEKRRSFLQEFCKKYGGVSRPQSHLFHIVSRIYVEDKHKVLYCEVPKAGCSNWKRILMVLNGLAPSTYNISHDAVHYGKYLKKLDSFDLKGIYTRLNTYTKAVFVRDPMERLVSAFRDKFEHPNSYYHPVFGKAIIKKYRPNACEEALNNGSGVKFKEFIHYLLDSHRPVGMDIHWEKVHKLCYPCLINYDFVGKFETLEEDANYFLQLIGAPKELKFPNFKDRHSSDERTNAEVVRQYLKDLTRTERQLIYDFYYLDYLMFNYTTPFL
ncbi:carbohydrate sulfotransferase 9 [Talpa occidentalis]|uniref:carbohydrate sulfotransferase 9 n=1 Tax=Talpa occidentalis TaxID=50954 RepID=UPI0023F7BE92|nr:carbohydrate sulfotransferase 9 [Talpa occidentalis]XP_054550091.1 carbohydrate sulfotransferase 9 [Talpa occidentalis]XP_054550092.1 carbohydrate sulfotransferase 9 [Talpa occidentalis]XP_054550093.1 carbohydrate sulfotransferase 9 [Talpa occidentalis]XP_054550094.1 carbohydrate sulfotransferase 9 [Talpa occidentalis]